MHPSEVFERSLNIQMLVGFHQAKELLEFVGQRIILILIAYFSLRTVYGLLAMCTRTQVDRAQTEWYEKRRRERVTNAKVPFHPNQFQGGL